MILLHMQCFLTDQCFKSPVEQIHWHLILKKMSRGGEEKLFCEYIILVSELSSSFNLVLFSILCGFRIFL